MENVNTLEDNVIKSFANVRNDVVELKKNVSMLMAKPENMSPADNTSYFEDKMRKLFENQKHLLLRIRNIEKKMIAKTIKISSKKASFNVKKEFVGSKASLKLHNPVCPFAKNIKPKNKASFVTKRKAFNIGYKACDCLKKI